MSIRYLYELTNSSTSDTISARLEKSDIAFLKKHKIPFSSQTDGTGNLFSVNSRKLKDKFCNR